MFRDKRVRYCLDAFRNASLHSRRCTRLHRTFASTPDFPQETKPTSKEDPDFHEQIAADQLKLVCYLLFDSPLMSFSQERQSLLQSELSPPLAAPPTRWFPMQSCLIG